MIATTIAISCAALLIIAAINAQRREVNKMTKALENLNASITALTTAVDAVVPVLGSPRASEAEIQAAADAVAAQAARLTGTPATP